MIYSYMINKSLGNFMRIVEYNKTKDMFYVQSPPKNSKVRAMTLRQVLNSARSLNPKFYKRLRRKYPEVFL